MLMYDIVPRYKAKHVRIELSVTFHVHGNHNPSLSNRSQPQQREVSAEQGVSAQQFGTETPKVIVQSSVVPSTCKNKHENMKK